jgi:Zn-dependent peptidase ImmA (M78 family)
MFSRTCASLRPRFSAVAGNEWKYGETAANALRYELDLGASVVDLRDVIRRLGVLLLAHDFGPEGGDGRYIKQGNLHVITINKAVQNQGRVRFTIAHELGHHRMHSEDGETVVFVDDQLDLVGKDPREKEADAFAAYLLAPTKALKADLEGVKDITFDTVIELMARYGLSYRALVYRLINTEIINKKQADALINDSEGRIEAAVATQGIHAKDAQALLGAEVPDSLRENSLKLYAHGLIAFDRLSEMLRIDAGAVTKLLEDRGITLPDTLVLDDSDYAAILSSEDNLE